MKFQIGQMVRCKEPACEAMKIHTGHVGVILGRIQGRSGWLVDGAAKGSGGKPCYWKDEHLTPIPPDNESAGTWDEVMAEFKAPALTA